MQIACDVIYSRILNTSYISHSEKYYPNQLAKFIQTLRECSVGAYLWKNWMNFTGFLRDILCFVNLIPNARVDDITN